MTMNEHSCRNMIHISSYSFIILMSLVLHVNTPRNNNHNVTLISTTSSFPTSKDSTEKRCMFLLGWSTVATRFTRDKSILLFLHISLSDKLMNFAQTFFWLWIFSFKISVLCNFRKTQYCKFPLIFRID